MSRSWFKVLVLCLGALAAFARAQPMAPAGMGFAVVNAFPNLTFEDPTVFLPEPGTNRIFVCERQGKIWYFDNDPAVSTKTLFLDLSAQTQGYNDSGILGMAFHPQYGQAGSPNRGYFYLYYNYTPGPIIGSESAPPSNVTPSYDRLSRFTVPDGADAADPASELVLMNQFDRDLWHNGGDMFFGPGGFLYFSNGDEGGSNDQYHQTQKINSGLFSGVFRIDVDMNPSTSHAIRRQPIPGAEPPAGWPATYTGNYYIPNDNPWQDPSGGTLEEFWALGFRSPHRLTLDAQTGLIWCGDVGQTMSEEVDIIQPGGNYQWSYMEGDVTGPLPKPSPLIGVDVPPIYAYPHFNGNGCVIGGYVYRGSRLAAQLGGQYIFGDYDSNRVWSMSYSGSGTPTVSYLGTVPGMNKAVYQGGISTFGVDAAGELYICTIGPSASIYRLEPAGSANYLADISARASVGTGPNVLIAGFVLGGSGTANVLLRGIGPALAADPFDVPGVLEEPEITLTSPSPYTLIATGEAWGGSASLADAFTAAGAFALPADSADAALLETLSAGPYTSEVSGVDSTTGVALAEVYDSGQGGGSATLENISARAAVGTGANILIAGFVIEGTEPAQVLLRGIGPTLGTLYGVSGALAQPEIDLFDSSGVLVQSNTGWADDTTLSAAFSLAGAFALPSGSVDAAMVAVLPPGSYTVELSGVGSTTGVGLVEVYLLH